jgi:Flp pilus assembly pilin Flp
MTEFRRSAVPADRARAEEGQALVEYALVLGLVALAALGSLTLLGENISALLGFLASALEAAVPGG